MRKLLLIMIASGEQHRLANQPAAMRDRAPLQGWPSSFRAMLVLSSFPPADRHRDHH